MAWNPHPDVAKARTLARELGFEQIMIVAVSRKKNQLKLVTYGETKALCANAKQLGDAAYNAVYKKLEEEL